MAMPGDVRSIREADVCPCQYDNCSAPATQEFCTEVDSMGAEWLPLCDEHTEQFKEDVADAQAIGEGECEWCQAKGVQTAPFRDWQEGTQGPLYDVCETCRGKSIDMANSLADTVPEDDEEEENFSTMPDLTDEAITHLFGDDTNNECAMQGEEEAGCMFEKLTMHQHTGTSDMQGTHFNLNGPLLHDGQVGFSAHYQDGIQFALCLDLQIGVLFWRVHFPREFYFITLEDRIGAIKRRIAAYGYRVIDIEEL